TPAIHRERPEAARRLRLDDDLAIIGHPPGLRPAAHCQVDQNAVAPRDSMPTDVDALFALASDESIAVERQRVALLAFRLRQQIKDAVVPVERSPEHGVAVLVDIVRPPDDLSARVDLCWLAIEAEVANARAVPDRDVQIVGDTEDLATLIDIPHAEERNKR